MRDWYTDSINYKYLGRVDRCMSEQIQKAENDVFVEQVDYGHTGKAHHTRRDEFIANGVYAEAGFDTTRFPSPTQFLFALIEGGVVDTDLAGMEIDEGVYYNPHKDSHYNEVHRNPHNYNFTWSDGEVLIVTSINPFTGRHGMKDYDAMLEASEQGLPNRKNVCGYIGIEGKKERVDRLVASLKANSNHVKGFDPDERSFV